MSNSDSQDPVQIAAAATTPAATAEPRGGMSFLNVLIVAVACSAISGYASWRLSAPRAVQQVVMFDAEKIASARIEQAMSKPDITEAEAAAAGQQFVRELNQELNRYTEAGIVVVNSSVVLNRPAGLDVTKDIASALGVAIK